MRGKSFRLACLVRSDTSTSSQCQAKKSGETPASDTDRDALARRSDVGRLQFLKKMPVQL